MARRTDHTREELKELIITAAWQIIETEGASGLTARKLATAIGYAPGTIYNLFQSMDALYLAINKIILGKLHDVLSSPACHDPNKTPIENMKHMAYLYRGFAQDHKQHWLMLFTHSLTDGHGIPEWYQDEITTLFSPLENLLRPYFANDQSRELKMATRVLWSSVHGLCFLEETGKIALIDDGETAPNMASYLIDNFIAGLEANTNSSQ